MRKGEKSLNCLVIPPGLNATQSNENEEFLVNKEEIEGALIARNVRHLNQAHTSGVIQSGCIEDIVENSRQDQILDGKYKGGRNQAFDRLAKGLAHKAEEENGKITPERLAGKWRKAKTGKSSAHNIISYVILKFLSNSSYIMEIMAAFYTKIVINHTVLHRWKEATALMLEKGKGPRIDKLRIIQLINADLRMLMRTLISPVANKVADEGKLNLSQYARKQETTISALIEKRLLLENSILHCKDSPFNCFGLTSFMIFSIM